MLKLIRFIKSSESHCSFLPYKTNLINVLGSILAYNDGRGKIVEKIHKMYPQISVIITLGEKGSIFLSNDGKKTKCKAIP